MKLLCWPGRDWCLQRVATHTRTSGKFWIPRGDILRFGLCVKAKAKEAVIVLGFFSHCLFLLLEGFVSLSVFRIFFCASYIHKKLHF